MRLSVSTWRLATTALSRRSVSAFRPSSHLQSLSCSSSSFSPRPHHALSSPSPRLVPIFSLSSSRSMSTYSTPEGTTLSRQGELLRYTVPDLSETMAKYLRSVEPFLEADEMEECKKQCEEFAAKGGEGEKLQEILNKRAAENDNWISDWWLEFAYLGYRNSVVVNSSPGLLYPKQEFNSDEDQMDYAARLVSGFLDFKEMLDKQVIPIETMGKEPLDMNQYYQLFGTNRVPGKKTDELSFNPDSKHIVVIHDGYYYKLPVYCSDGKPLSTKYIYANLLYIAEHVKEEAKGEIGAGVLTADNRDAWYDAYSLLMLDNEKSVKEIETSLFALCLDPPHEGGLDEDADAGLAAAHAMHGNALTKSKHNRWFDKTIQIFVSRSGQSGLTYEHSTAEAVSLMNVTNHVLHCANGGTKFCPDETNTGKVDSKPQQLEFKNLDRLKKKMESANEHIEAAAKDLEMLILNFKSFGKNFVKKQGFSPDSFMQMAIQLAFYRIHQTAGAHYESAGLRRYKHGRTDIIRSCSSESIAFARAMLDPSLSNTVKMTAMSKALKSHSAYAHMTSRGEGVDRHLFGLMIAAMENGMPMPVIFNEPAYIRSTRHRLSTSQVSGAHPAVVLYGPLVADGYGVCYNNRENDITVSISAARSCPETTALEFKNAVEKSMMEMHDLLNAENNK